MVGREKFAIYSGSSWILLSRGWFTHRGGRILMRHRSPTIVRAIAHIRFPPNENYNSISPAALHSFVIFLLTFRRGIHQRLENRSDAKGKIQNTVVIEVATIVKGKTFYELIRRNKSGDRSGNELRCVNDGRHGSGVANIACWT